jgi:hypothetical protein
VPKRVRALPHVAKYATDHGVNLETPRLAHFRGGRGSLTVDDVEGGCAAVGLLPPAYQSLPARACLSLLGPARLID